ncbi:hypothetical protein ARMGADRAFT_1038431 [Armillaria gallica]|uniref:Uncharacterized protein n=1 Tax=Armillaria gallica TaxID=47427 RepID=A0A2H3CW11_ARMGA|nr:hypothetical protein ARMGADRAFT_1038431 [Armillaria gallica]
MTKGLIDHFKPHNLGVSTVVQVLCGHQLWYLFWCHVGDRYISALKDWNPNLIKDGKGWNSTLVVLKPGNALKGRYIQLETLHAVVTLKHSVIHITLPKTVSGWVGTCMQRVKINETIYAQLWDIILRLMVYYNLGIEATDSHIPEMQMSKGLLDIVALGNLCLFLSVLENFTALNYPKANSTLPKARRAYLDLIYQLCENYSLILLSDKESTYSYEELFHHPLGSHDITEFAKSSAIKVAGWRQLDIIHFEQSVKQCLDFFFSSDLDDALLNASIDRRDRLFHFNHQILVWPKSSPLNVKTVTKWAENVIRELQQIVESFK